MTIVYGGSDAFDALLYPGQNQANTQYFQQQFQTLSNTLTEYGRSFIAGAQEVYDRLNSSAIVNLGRAALRAAEGLFHPNQIVEIDNLESLQMAQPMMQRWVMSEPTIRAMYHKGTCAGYSDTYVDMSPGKIGEEDYNYRRVMNGVFDEKQGAFKEYYETLYKDDRELIAAEKLDILSTWDIVRMFAEARGADPTDPYGGML